MVWQGIEKDTEFVQALFTRFDTDGSGTIDRDEFEALGEHIAKTLARSGWARYRKGNGQKKKGHRKKPSGSERVEVDAASGPEQEKPRPETPSRREATDGMPSAVLRPSLSAPITPTEVQVATRTGNPVVDRTPPPITPRRFRSSVRAVETSNYLAKLARGEDQQLPAP